LGDDHLNNEGLLLKNGDFESSWVGFIKVCDLIKNKMRWFQSARVKMTLWKLLGQDKDISEDWNVVWNEKWLNKTCWIIFIIGWGGVSLKTGWEIMLKIGECGGKDWNYIKRGRNTLGFIPRTKVDPSKFNLKMKTLVK